MSKFIFKNMAVFMGKRKLSPPARAARAPGATGAGASTGSSNGFPFAIMRGKQGEFAFDLGAAASFARGRGIGFAHRPQQAEFPAA